MGLDFENLYGRNTIGFTALYRVRALPPVDFNRGKSLSG